jgi:hypothetical protein
MANKEEDKKARRHRHLRGILKKLGFYVRRQARKGNDQNSEQVKILARQASDLAAKMFAAS